LDRKENFAVSERKSRAAGRPAQFADRDPDASVYDGRTLLGFLVDEPTQCAALDSSRFLIGLFPDRKAANPRHHQSSQEGF